MPDPLDPPPLMGDADVLNPGQKLLDTVLSGTATIQRKTATPDGLGTQTEAWNDLYTNVPCNLTSSKKWAEGEKGEEIKAISIWRCDFPLGTDCLPKDRVVSGGVTFEVTETDEGITGGLFLCAQLVKFRRN